VPLLYRRERDGEAVVVALNLGAEPASITSEVIGPDGEILLYGPRGRGHSRRAGSARQ
jgi:hypothetical protein